MKSFKQYTEEKTPIKDSIKKDEPMELTTNIDIFSDDNVNEAMLLEAMSSNDKGVMHEILTGYHLNRGKHMSPESEKAHNEIKKKTTKDEYDNANKLAKGTAEHIRKHFKGDVKSVHWSSKPGDIGRVTGVHETQQENPSDIIVRHKDGSHTGLSLKVTGKKHGKVPVGNPGARQTDSQLGVSTTHHYDNAREKLRSQFKELKNASNKDMKAAIKSSPKMREVADKHSNEAIKKIRDTWHNSLSKMNTKQLSNHLRNNLLHAKNTKTKMFKVTTGGHGGDHSVEVEHPATAHDHILNNHQHLSVEKSGNNSIVFKHKDKVFLRHRLKPESTPLATSLKGSAE